MNNLRLTADSRGGLEEADSRGGLEEAVGCSKESLALHRVLGNDWGVAIAMNGLGLTARKEGWLQEAQAYLAESLSIFAQMEDAGGVLYCLQGLAET